MDQRTLSELLKQADPHGITRAADAARQALHGARTTVGAVAHLDAQSVRDFCQICGERRESGQFVASVEELSSAATEIHLLTPSAGSQAERDGALAALKAWMSGAPALPGGLERTWQLGTLSDWRHWEQEENLELGPIFSESLQILSDGIRPEWHAALGDREAEHADRIWRLAAQAGLRGQATLLYGPAHSLDGLLRQVGKLAGLQAELEIFDSACPTIYNPAGYAGLADHMLTQASADLRAWAAARLGLPTIPHVRIELSATDLKSAHFALASGVDDLNGGLILRLRSIPENADADDLSLAEAGPWLSQCGFEPHLRNGLHASTSLDGGQWAAGA